MSDSDFHSELHKGNPLGALQHAAIYAVLWAIGTSWSTAIREIAVVLVGEDTFDVVLAELFAAGVTTVIGIGIAFCATQCCNAAYGFGRQPTQQPTLHTRPTSATPRTKKRIRAQSR